MTPEQKNEFVETCRAAVSAVLTAITQDDPRFWLEGKYLRWGAIEKALMTGIESAAGALVTHDPYMPTPEEWAEYPKTEWAATDGEGRLWLFADKPYYTPGTSTIWRCGGCELIPLRFAAPPPTSAPPRAIVPKVSNDARYRRR